MANVKEKIATNLLGRYVTTKDARIHSVGPCGWPMWWPKIEDRDPPLKNADGSVFHERLAEVVGVFVLDGEVKLVLRCASSGEPQPLHTGNAKDWGDSVKEMITYTCPECGHTWRRAKRTFYIPDPKKLCRAHYLLRSARVHAYYADKLRTQARVILAKRAQEG